MSVDATPAQSPDTSTGSRRWSVSAAAALFLIGTSAPVAVFLHGYPLLGGQAVRFLLAALILCALLPVFGTGSQRLSWGVVSGLALLGLVGVAGFNVFLVAATHHSDPAIIATVLAAAPVALAVLTPVLERRRIGPRVVGGCVLVAAGTTLAAGSGTTSVWGGLLCAAALGCELLFTLLAVPLIRRIGAWRTTTYAVLAAGLFLAAGALLFDGLGQFLAVPQPAELAGLLYLAVGVGVIANLLWYTALHRIAADRAGLFYALTPLGALIVGLLLGSSSPHLIELVGLAAATTGLAIGLSPPRTHRA